MKDNSNAPIAQPVVPPMPHQRLATGSPVQMPAMPVGGPPRPMTPQVPPPPPIVDWLCGADLIGPAPAREWLVYEMIPMRNVTLLYGDGGTGKSLLALQLAASTVLGQFWLNRFTKAGPALYLSAEDDRNELHRRLTAIIGHHQRTMADLTHLTIANMAGRDALLASLGKDGALRPTAVLTEIERRVAAIGANLVVLDTLADIFPGNENDRSQVRQFVGLIRGLAIRNNCAVVILAHPSLTGISSGSGASGSTAWSNSVRSRLYFERIKNEGYENNPDARRLKVMKSNYGPIDTEIELRWSNGVFIAQSIAGEVDTHAKAERVFLSILERTHMQGRYFNTLHAPNEFSKMPEREGLSKRALKDAMERLFANGTITVRTIRENRRDRNVIWLDQPIQERG